MRAKIITVIAVVALLAITYHLGQQHGVMPTVAPESLYITSVRTQDHNDNGEHSKNRSLPAGPRHQDNDDFTTRLGQITRWLETGNADLAAHYVNEHYAEFSSDQLDEIKNRFLRSNAHSRVQLEQLQTATDVFDDLDSWHALAQLALQLNQWSIAFDALLRTSTLQNNPVQLEANLVNLVRSASHLMSGLEQRGDELGIKALYQSAYDLHPTYPRFQLELAHAHLRLNETENARRLLSALVYDPELGSVAQQTLTQMDASQSRAAPERSRVAAIQRNDVVVPLMRSGNSFLIETAINNQSTRLLLDTGASITALSSQLIERLNLQATGATIQLNTANGTRTARIFAADKIRLGRLQFSGLHIAEIDLESTAGFDGLLGTDALNHVELDYSYVIDNNRNALIFRRR